MEFREEKSTGRTTYRLKGRFTYADHASFRTILGAIGSGGVPEFAFDLSELEFIDSAGMGMLLLANDSAETAGVTLTLSRPSGQVRRVFEGQKFATVFTLED